MLVVLDTLFSVNYTYPSFKLRKFCLLGGILIAKLAAYILSMPRMQNEFV
jgi:hypothetical protein